MRLLALDGLASGDAPMRLRARCLALFGAPCGGVPVEFRSRAGAALGSARTDADGYAEAAVGGYSGPFLAAAQGAPESPGCAYRFPPAARFLVTDLDRTVSRPSPFFFWVLPEGLVSPLEGAPEALRRLSSRYGILYLTARRDPMLPKTRRWLALHLFPPGPILCRPWSLRPVAPELFKTETLARIKRELPGLAAGVGDRAHDARAYLAHGLRALLINSFEPPPLGAEHFRSWPDIGRAL